MDKNPADIITILESILQHLGGDLTRLTHAQLLHTLQTVKALLEAIVVVHGKE
jgi:hypothetical protein